MELLTTVLFVNIRRLSVGKLTGLPIRDRHDSQTRNRRSWSPFPALVLFFFCRFGTGKMTDTVFFHPMHQSGRMEGNRFSPSCLKWRLQIKTPSLRSDAFLYRRVLRWREVLIILFGYFFLLNAGAPYPQNRQNSVFFLILFVVTINRRWGGSSVLSRQYSSTLGFR